MASASFWRTDLRGSGTAVIAVTGHMDLTEESFVLALVASSCRSEWPNV